MARSDVLVPADWAESNPDTAAVGFVEVSHFKLDGRGSVRLLDGDRTKLDRRPLPGGCVGAPIKLGS